ncbi:hypothetical protein PBR20603_01167 [Pandoraea bronchicola]|uniref:Uncharacterized protein n=1 Tax=Pandoraea bronchicola TaxID=2508287 RepID=A0A5E5BMY8_9BURK|nr:hypothetical protein PBR20603_01167 [Pandoraea bronchicola]
MRGVARATARSGAVCRSLPRLRGESGATMCPVMSCVDGNQGVQPANCRSTCAARGTGATAPYPVVDNAAHTFA